MNDAFVISYGIDSWLAHQGLSQSLEPSTRRALYLFSIKQRHKHKIYRNM